MCGQVRRVSLDLTDGAFQMVTFCRKILLVKSMDNKES